MFRVDYKSNIIKLILKIPIFLKKDFLSIKINKFDNLKIIYSCEESLSYAILFSSESMK